MHSSGSSSRRGALSAEMASACLNKTSLAAVNGKSTGLTFTPGEHYVITGCGFGSTPAQVYLIGGFPAHGGKIALQPYHAFGTPLTPGWGVHWSDRQIDAELDQAVSGELDQNNISVVVQTSTGAQVELNGFSFYAQRGVPLLLSKIPASAFCNSYGQPTSCTEPGNVSQLGALASPCGAWVMSNCTVEVLREGFHGVPPGGFPQDVYTIDLKPGFVLYSATVQVASQTAVTNLVQPVIKGSQILVGWPYSGNPSDLNSFTFSLYGLRIFVVGPVGVSDPWASGQ